MAEYESVSVSPERLLPEFRDNPLIASLPEVMPMKEAFKRMLNKAPYDVQERQLPDELRWIVLARLRSLVIPLTHYVYFERTFSRLIRMNYIDRNPKLPEVWSKVYQAGAAFEEFGAFRKVAKYDSELFVVGLSGLGKSTMVEATLRAYGPQVVHHGNIGGGLTDTVQIKWLKINCPSKANVDSLCREVLRAVDHALGVPKFFQMYNSSYVKTSVLEGLIRQAFSTYFVGVLIVDEIQNMSLSKSGGAEFIKAFMLSLREDLGVPLILIGTYKAIRIIGREMKDSRRVSESGIFEVLRPAQQSEEWNKFLDSVWAYQWTRQPTPLDEKLRQTIWKLTQGVTDFFIILYKLAQEEVIGQKKEIITPSLLESVFRHRLPLLAPAIDALSSGDPRVLSRFDDLLPPKEILDGLFRVPGMMSLFLDSDENSPHDVSTCPTNQVSEIKSELSNDDAIRFSIMLPEGYMDLRGFVEAEDVYASLKKYGFVADPTDYSLEATRD